MKINSKKEKKPLRELFGSAQIKKDSRDLIYKLRKEWESKWMELK